MKKRILSLLMAVVVLVTFGALAVSAEDAVVEDVPVEDVPVGTGINITKPNMPEYYYTTKVTNNFPTAPNTFLSNETVDPGISVPGEYAVVGGDFTLALEEGKATVTYGEETGAYDLLRLLFKAQTLNGANYLTFHIDTTNLSGNSYFNLRLNNIWKVYSLKEGSSYYFLPDATEENPNPKRETFVVGDTSFEGFKMPAGVTGTIYLPETSFVNSETYDVAEFDNYLQWSCDHNTRQNAAIYLENKQEYDGGAVAGDSIVFGDICWVKEDSVALNMPYNAEYMFNDYSATATGNASFTAINAWDNWRSVRINKAFDNSFEALKFDLDYSEFTLVTNGNTIKLYFSFRDNETWDYHNFWVSGEAYLIGEDGKVYKLEAGGTTKQIPAGFKGSVIIPFTSFGADSHATNTMDIFSAGQNEYSLSMQVYGNASETVLTAYVDNIGFLTTYHATDLVSARAQIMEEAFEETAKTVDVNGDGKVDALDIVALKKIVSWAA